jgi:hypothetical protein
MVALGAYLAAAQVQQLTPDFVLSKSDAVARYRSLDLGP